MESDNNQQNNQAISGPICQDCKNWTVINECQQKPFNMPACQFFVKKSGRPANPNKARVRMPITVAQPMTQAVSQPAIQPSQPMTQAVSQPASNDKLNLASIPESNPDLIKSGQWAKCYNKLKSYLASPNENIMVSGPAGTGKNQLIYELAHELNQPVIRISFSGDMRTSALLGRPNPDKNGLIIWQDGPLAEAMRTGAWAIVDEINMADSDILAVLHEVLESKKSGRQLLVASNSEIITAQPTFRIIGTCNHGYVGTKPLNQATMDRFTAYMALEYSEEVDKAIIARAGLDERIEKAVLTMMGQIRELVKNNELSQPFGHRTLDNVVRLYKLNQDIVESILDGYANKLPDYEKPAVSMLTRDLASLIREIKKEEAVSNDQ